MKILVNEAEEQSGMYFVFQVKCLSLLTDRKQIYIFCRTSPVRGNSGVSWKSPPPDGIRDTAEKVFCSPRKIVDRSNPTDVVCVACEYSAMCGITGIFSGWETRYNRGGGLFSKGSSLSYWPMATTLTRLLGNARRELGVTFLVTFRHRASSI